MIGRALQVVIRELADKNLGLGFQNLKGTRDQAKAGERLCRQLGCKTAPLMLEMDMDDMFWEIPPNEIALAIEWAFRTTAGEN